MKTQSELDAIQEEIVALNNKLAELSKEEMRQVLGGNDPVVKAKTLMKCRCCSFTIVWHNDFYNQVFKCPKCRKMDLEGVEILDY